MQHDPSVVFYLSGSGCALAAYGSATQRSSGRCTGVRQLLLNRCKMLMSSALLGLLKPSLCQIYCACNPVLSHTATQPHSHKARAATFPRVASFQAGSATAPCLYLRAAPGTSIEASVEALLCLRRLVWRRGSWAEAHVSACMSKERCYR